MQVRSVLLTVVYRTQQLLVLKERPILYILRDQSEILIDDTSGSYVHMADLRVAHLSVGETYRQSGSISLLKRTLSHQSVHHRCLCHVYGIRIVIIRQSVSIQHHHHYRFLSHIISSSSRLRRYQ